MFYLSSGSGIITPLEFGKELGRAARPSCLVLTKASTDHSDIETRSIFEQPELPIYHTLDEMLAAVA